MTRHAQAVLSLALAVALGSGCSPRNAIPPVETGGGDCPDSAWPATPAAFADYSGEGASLGNFLGDWSLLDQHGCRTDSTQFLGAVTVLDISSVWCGPCNEAASTSMEVFEAIRQQSKATWLVTMLVQDAFAGPARPSDAQAWATDYSLEYPVVIDEAEASRLEYGVLAFPVFLFIAPTGEVYERIEGKPEDSEILDLMEFGLEEWASDLRPEDEIPEPGTELPIE